MIIQPPVLAGAFGLFQKRVEGDDCLLELARLRFHEAGMNAEMYAATPEELDWLLKFRPFPEAPVMLHLARDIDWTTPVGQDRIGAFANRFAGRLRGMVVHDQADMAVRTEDFLQAARELDSRLSGIENGPLLFIEYAAGIKPATFAAFFNSIRNLSHVSACIDVGHVGIFQVRRTYSRTHPKEDVCALKTAGDRLSPVLPDVQAAVDAALPEVLKLIDVLGCLGKPLHFHLHDGHPLSRFSPFGVSDHLSFFEEIPLASPVRGRRTLPTMFGPAGLSSIVSAAMNTSSAEDISFTLEIHPKFERLPLGNAAELFSHWRDKTNAEQMNHWLDILRRNHALLLNALPSVSAR